MRGCWLGLIALSAAALFAAGEEEPIRSEPSPGPRDDASKINGVRPKPSSRPRVDPFDEPIVALPPVELHFKKEEELKQKEKELRESGALKADATLIDKDTVLEKLEYDITVDRLPAGKATIKLHRQENYGKTNPVPVYTISLNTRTNRAIGLRYEVEDNARAVFDARGSFSRFFFMDRKEGNSKVAERITFDYQTAVMAAVYERPRTGADGKSNWVTSKIPLNGKALDPLGAVYYMRAYAVKDPETKKSPLETFQLDKFKPALTLPVCSDRHVWNTNLFAVGRENLDIGNLKNRDCKIFEVDAPFRGLFERVGKMRVWIDVETGVALKMTAEIPIGLAEAILNVNPKNSENLPSPLQDAK